MPPKMATLATHPRTIRVKRAQNFKAHLFP
jgi:hypothetical protein